MQRAAMEKVMIKKKFFKTKDECEVTFELALEKSAELKDVTAAVLICDVNGWQPIPMKKLKKGPFKARMRFPKDDQFQFRYLLDDQYWINDDAADDYLPNGMGGQNGVLVTEASA